MAGRAGLGAAWTRSRTRSALRARTLDALSAVASAEALARPRVHVLCLHHVEPHERRGFAALLEFLAEGHELISYPEAVRRAREADYPRPAVAVTFDDGFASCLVAADILERYGARGCFFVCPGTIGLAGSEAHAVSEARFATPGMEFLTAEELRDLDGRGHEIGVHTFEHSRVSGLSVRQFRDDLGRCEERFAELGLDPRHFAWPYGTPSDFGDPYRVAVADSGLASCASSVRGAHGGSDPLPDDGYVLRENVAASWPVSRHVRYFLARSARRLS